jgi:hypothetical protein
MSKRIEIKKHLKPLFDDKSRHIVIVAHRRFGKTSFALYKTILSALENAKSRYFVILPTYKQAKMVAWGMLLDFTRDLQVVRKANDSELLLEFTNGSKIELKGSDYPDSLRGVGLDGVVLDEYAMQDPSIYSEIIRPALADKAGWSVKISTPKGKNFFYDDWIMSGAKYNFKASETGVINQGELDQAKQEMSHDEYQQEFENEFLYFAGQIYKEFKREIHVIEPREVLGRNLISIDHGQRNPTSVGFYTVDYDGKVFKTDEIYEAGLEVQEICRRIKAKWVGKDNPQGVIDPSTAAHDRFKHGIPYSIYQEYLDNGVELELAPNQVLGGINLVKQRLTNKDFFIFNRCENTIKEFENYRWKAKRSADSNLPEEPLKVDDHAVDETRYLIASQYEATMPKPPKPEAKEMTLEYCRAVADRQAGVKRKRRTKEYAYFR